MFRVRRHRPVPRRDLPGAGSPSPRARSTGHRESRHGFRRSFQSRISAGTGLKNVLQTTAPERALRASRPPPSAASCARRCASSKSPTCSHDVAQIRARRAEAFVARFRALIVPYLVDPGVPPRARTDFLEIRHWFAPRALCRGVGVHAEAVEASEVAGPGGAARVRRLSFSLSVLSPRTRMANAPPIDRRLVVP